MKRLKFIGFFGCIVAIAIAVGINCGNTEKEKSYQLYFNEDLIMVMDGDQLLVNIPHDSCKLLSKALWEDNE